MPYSSVQVNAAAARGRAARPVIGTVAPVTGAYQSGEAIDASGGMRAVGRRAHGLPHVRAAVAEVGVEAVLRRVGDARRRRCCARQDVLGGLLEQRPRLVGGQLDARGSRAAEITSAAAPAALPVFVEPVGPCIEIEDLPPNCAVFALRK